MSSQQTEQESILEDEYIFEGYMIDTKINGFGRIIYSNGDFYEGPLEEGICNGQGKSICADGYSYEG